MTDYTEYVPLKNYSLEESWVLGITCVPGEVTFELDVVLAKSHPAVRPAAVGEMFDSRRASLTFSGVAAVNWSAQRLAPATDASGELDFGHIDEMSVRKNRFTLSGDWGRMEIVAASAAITLTRD